MNLRLLRLPKLIVAALALSLAAVACVPPGPTVTTTVPSVDLSRYTGTWYEIASVKQFFSAGLVNTTATYTERADGTIEVLNRGRYFFAGGPETTIVGTAVPVDASNARLNVTFNGSSSNNPPGNYWIVDLDADYEWAIVSDPTGFTCFILTRERTVSDELRAELLDRAAAAGVDTSQVTVTPQL